MFSLSPTELAQWRQKGKTHAILDVRELGEPHEPSITGISIPLAELTFRKDEIPKDLPVVVICRSGKRSLTAIRILEMEFGFQNLYNLSGGITEWHRALNSNKESEPR